MNAPAAHPTSQTAPLPSSKLIPQKTPPPTPARGLYGNAGWLEDTGIDVFLAPFASAHWYGSDYARFEGIGHREAATLLDSLPQGNLFDRQNRGPSVKEILRLLNRKPTCQASGYVIRFPRYDERLTFDGLFIPSSILAPAAAHSSPDTAINWDHTRILLGLSPATGEPDECRLLPMSPMGHLAYFLWWD